MNSKPINLDSNSLYNLFKTNYDEFKKVVISTNKDVEIVNIIIKNINEIFNNNYNNIMFSDNEIEPYSIKYNGELLFNQKINTWLSHKYLCEFEIDGIKFNSVEQYLIYKKAELFNDFNIMNKVYKSIDPYEMHYLGRSIENYDDDKWIMIREYISYIGNKAKFLQNKDLYIKLYDTLYKELIYSVDYDPVWGKFMKKGQNLLGRALMRVRENDILSLSKLFISSKKNNNNIYSIKRSHNISKDDIEFCYANNIDLSN
jgi:hypothetical protein